jgi:hypothetical protein
MLIGAAVFIDKSALHFVCSSAADAVALQVLLEVGVMTAPLLFHFQRGDALFFLYRNTAQCGVFLLTDFF